MQLIKYSIHLFIITLFLVACAPVNDQQNVNIKSPAQKVDGQTTADAEKNKSASTSRSDNNKEFIWPSESAEESAVHAGAEKLDITRPLIQAFIQKMAIEHDFDEQYVSQLLSQAQNKESILKAISRPAEKSKEWFEYRPIFLNSGRIDAGKAFMQTHKASLQAAEDLYGVSAEIITAIIGVETLYGKISGKYKVLDSLVTLGFNYPPRSKFFRQELEEFLLLCREEKFEPTAILGSYAGAMGNGQFISSSYRNYAVDGDGDGIKDLWNSWPDAIHSIANYFHVHKWKPAQPVITAATMPDKLKAIYTDTKVNLNDHTVGSLKQQGLIFNTALEHTEPAIVVIMQQENGPEYFVAFNNFYSITRYNRSPMYALAVYQLSQELGSSFKAGIEIN